MKILHMYHDFMNLYGDYANITVLKKLLESNGAEVEVGRMPLGGEAALDEYDFIYIGSGTERNLKVMLEDLRRFEKQLTAYIGAEKVMLMTGNSFEALGKSITDCDGREYEGLGVFGFESVEQNKERLVGDIIYDCPFLAGPVVGFVNKCSEIAGVDEPMFSVKMGLGNRKGDSGEGVRMNNLLCTHVTGPVLVKNPHMLRYLAELILGRPVDDSCLNYEKKGYEVTLRELTKRIENK